MGDLADLLRPRRLLTGPDPTPPVMVATVLDVDPLRVKVPEFDGGKNALAAFGPANGLAEGDEVRVTLDSGGQFVVIAADAAPAGGGPPSGPAGGVLSGIYPNPGFAADMATQAELNAEATARDAADVDLAGDIAAEAGARAAADTTEATTRAAADTTLNAAISDHLADTVDAHDASAISFVAAGGIIATNVQAALQELDTEKATTVALAAHEADTTSIHGIADTSTLYRAGGTDVAVADGGTGASSASAARTALGVDAAGAQRPPQGPETNLKVIRGTVNTAGSGTIVQGSGFTITRNGVGDVTVTFSSAFSTAPSGGLGTNADDATYIAMPSTTSFRVLLRNLTAGVLGAVDAQFTFAMTGPA